jgi:hypothetical protein
MNFNEIINQFQAEMIAKGITPPKGGPVEEPQKVVVLSYIHISSNSFTSSNIIQPHPC